jgi:transcriptional regulator with XRE-family HTH domain
MTRRIRDDLADKKIGGLIRMYREQRGLSLAAVAAPLGISFQQLAKHESGASVPAARLGRIAEVFGIPVTEFYIENEQGTQDGQSLSALLAKDGAAELLRAYGLIENRNVCTKVIEIVQAMVAVVIELQK